MKHTRITHDSFVNLSLLDIEYSDVRLLMTVPDLVFMYICDEMLGEVKELLRLPYDSSNHKQMVGYDTQFELGNIKVDHIISVSYTHLTLPTNRIV